MSYVPYLMRAVTPTITSRNAMKLLRFAPIIFLVLAFIVPLQAQAQLGGLRKRLSKKVEDKVERAVEQRVERAVDRQLDKMINSLADEIDSAIAGLIFSDKPSKPIELQTNETGPADAPYLRYTQATRIELGGMGMASRLIQKYGSQEQVVSIHQDRQRTDEGEEASQIVDVGTLSMTNLDHKQKQWWSMNFQEMMQATADMATEVQTSMEEAKAENDMEDVKGSIEVTDSKVEVFNTGKRQDINGSSALQTIVTVGGTYVITATDEETGETEQATGTSYVVYDIWQSKDIAGYQTMMDLQMKMGEGMGDAVANSGLQSMVESMNSMPQVQTSAEEAFEKVDPDNGIPLRSTVYFVQLDEGTEFDLDAVLAGKNTATDSPDETPSQIVIMSMVTEIGSVTTTPFEESYLEPPADYAQVASPLESMRSMQN
jgi:hypothetical protein